MLTTKLRQRRAVVAACALAALVLAACGGDSAAPESQTAQGQEDTSWSFTDDRGVTVTLDERPERIVAYNTTASALWHLGVEPVATFGGPLSTDNPDLIGVDISGMETVGEVYGEINMEKMLQLRPDVIVTNYDPRQDGPVFGFTEQPIMDQVEEIAPVIALDGIKDPIEVIGRFEDLAEALGADLSASKFTEAKARFEIAREALRAALAAKPGLKAMSFQSWSGEAQVNRPEAWPSLRQFAQLGLDLVDPVYDAADDPDDDWARFFGEPMTLEFVDKYPVDLILLSDAMGQAGRDDLAKVGTWANLPAVKARQIGSYRQLENWSYAAYATDFEALTDLVKRSDPDLVG